MKMILIVKKIPERLRHGAPARYYPFITSNGNNQNLNT